MSRLVLISNKHCDANDIVAAANDYSLTDWVDEHQGVWLGWNGDVQTFAEAEYRPIDDHQRDGYQFVTFPFSAREFHYHYQGYYHDGLWPVFHQQPELAHFSAENYQAYCQISQHIAAIACDYVCPSDLICVDDYQLLPCGAALKQQGLLNPCGFFFALPFPSVPLLKTIPQHRELMASLFYYDLIGFRSLADVNNFHHYLATEYAVERLPDNQLQVDGHIFTTAIFPDAVHASRVC
ncbi:trehalose-6-phosphate synthase [Serratia odorifera]|uniref:trehalose-6-phosphate synthase n=1 Tax=Serratia odorifera TaxID=618 RepID=UPI003531FC89